MKFEQVYESFMKQLRMVRESNLAVPEKYKAQYQSADGVTKEKMFTGPNAKKELKKWIDEWVGLNGDIDEDFNYIVSQDGIGRIAVKGIWLTDLLEKDKGPEKKGKDYLSNLLETSMLLTYPHIAKSPNRKKKNESHGDPSMIVDWQKSKIDRWGRNVKESWRLAFQISEDPYATVPTIELNMSVFMYNDMNSEEYRPIQEQYHFPSKDKEHDIDKICDFLENLKLEMEKIDFENNAPRLS